MSKQKYFSCKFRVKTRGNGYEVISRGIQQDDVCGPVIFAIALHMAVLKLEELGMHFQFWYLDDGVLC